ncbi:shikimate dehydrogenase [Vallitalea longa]|uniref:Shikimate dehydrogenase (NADP(+)) n=1 Tax=Vallitalea longa TaxID=2936439 RepID=A0A9W5YDE6_9FIRM|nr:shikimate dehydrogenase [Vallitalea longa]GKX31912.1 shikimate dehydrogenase [Vallitalea longa]
MRQKINGETKVLGLIGNPIEHTISPIIHNILASKLDMNYVYLPFKVENGMLDKAIEGARALNIKGLNVTVPYKEQVMDKLIEITPFAKQIGAVNTLKFTDNGYIGYNTDADGLNASLIKNSIKLKDSKIVIIGAGGAAKAVGMLCAREKCKKITIINRTVIKGQILANNIRQYYNVETKVLGLDEIGKIEPFDIAIQTTPIGMSPKVHDNPIDDTDFYKKFHIAVDLIYNPTKTEFLEEAEKNGIKILNGFGMLFYQGIKAYEVWNDIIITEDILEDVMNELINLYG